MVEISVFQEMTKDGEQAASKSLSGDGSSENENGPAAEADSEDIVTPWEVASASSSGVDYDKLLGKTE